MPARRKLLRRFEPRYGVSAEILVEEATFVAREREDYHLRSSHELRERLAMMTNLYRIANETLEVAVTPLREHEQLALRCLITRDLYLILELYCTHLGIPPNTVTEVQPSSKAKSSRRRREVATVEGPPTSLPFSEWLFGEAEGDAGDDID